MTHCSSDLVIWQPPSSNKCHLSDLPSWCSNVLIVPTVADTAFLWWPKMNCTSSYSLPKNNQVDTVLSLSFVNLCTPEFKKIKTVNFYAYLIIEPSSNAPSWATVQHDSRYCTWVVLLVYTRQIVPRHLRSFHVDWFTSFALCHKDRFPVPVS